MPESEPDRQRSMVSTPRPLTIVRPDGSRTESTTAYIVHPAGATVPDDAIVHRCDDARCPR